MICNRLICFLLILSTVPAADTIKKYSKLQSIIEGKELINDMVFLNDLSKNSFLLILVPNKILQN